MTYTLICMYCGKTVSDQQDVGTTCQSNTEICVCKVCLENRKDEMESAFEQALYRDEKTRKLAVLNIIRSGNYVAHWLAQDRGGPAWCLYVETDEPALDEGRPMGPEWKMSRLLYPAQTVKGYIEVSHE